MKILLLAFLGILLVPGLGFSQKIKLKGTHGTPVSQAVVIIKPLTEKRESIFLTDNSGSVEIGPYAGKVQIFVSHLSFENYVDTLDFITGDLTIQLVEKDIQLKEVVVSSEYSPRTAGESVYTVAVVNKQQIDNQAASSLDEVLKQQLNVRISQDQVLGSGVTMNGLSGQNIKFLVDGVPVIGRLDGNIDVSQINLSNVVRIELVNGPMATSYGTDAAGGVVNVITRQPSNNKYEGGVNFLYEDIGRYNVDASAGTSRGKSSLLIGGGRNFFDGWSVADTGRWQEWKPKEQILGNINYRYSGEKIILSYQLNAFAEKISNKGTPRMSPYFAYAFDEYYKTKRYTNQVNASYILRRDLFANATFSYSHYQRTKNTFRKDLVTLEENLVLGQVPDDSTSQSSILATQDTTRMQSWMARGTISKTNTEAPLNYQVGYDVNLENAAGTRFNESIKRTADIAILQVLNTMQPLDLKLNQPSGFHITPITNHLLYRRCFLNIRLLKI
ncbi:MAG: TonB-dependent receptor plug domain-containing protein [Bacteroidetes bacterium]|nr:TonB-dependent receptor plug domain-containing protein [Bacteroidota bacterium]